jgi:hypothetical protein
MAEEQGRPGQLTLELNCADFDVASASFSPAPGGEGGLFSCSIRLVSAETVAALDRAAQTHTRVNLLFTEHPLLLDLVTLERKAPHLVRIVGHIVQPTANGAARR